MVSFEKSLYKNVSFIDKDLFKNIAIYQIIVLNSLYNMWI